MAAAAAAARSERTNTQTSKNPETGDETLAVANTDLSVRGFSEKEYLGEVEVSFLHGAS